MIETLNGIFETVNCKQNTSLKLYDNSEYEDYPSHWHPSMEIIMPTENIYTLEINETTTVLNEYDIMFISPGCIHTIYAPPTGNRIIFQPDVKALRFLYEMDPLVTVMSPTVVVTKSSHPEIHEELKQKMLEIRDLYNKADPYYEFEIYARVIRMFSLIGQNMHNVTVTNLSQDYAKQEEYFARFLKICDYINDHCTEELTLESVADLSGFSKFYFSKLFKQFTNVTFYKYVNQKRIDLAAIMLIDPANSVTDVALSCGFSSLSPFIRMFKIVKGCTPTEFKNMYRSCCNSDEQQATIKSETEGSLDDIVG